MSITPMSWVPTLPKYYVEVRLFGCLLYSICLLLRVSSNFLFDTLNLSLCNIRASMQVPLTCAFYVHSNVCALIITIFIRYHTAVNSIHSTSPPLQTYHHMISSSVEVPTLTTARNSSSIGKPPVSQGSSAK